MAFEVVTSDNRIMPPFIFLYGLRLKIEIYIKCVEEVVHRWIKWVTARRPYVWQKVSVPCHTSRRTWCWLREYFCNHIISNKPSPNSPDCNPLVWGAVEKEANKTPCNTKDKLKARIMAAFTNSNKEASGKAYKVIWRLRLKPMAISLNEFNL